MRVPRGRNTSTSSAQSWRFVPDAILPGHRRAHWWSRQGHPHSGKAVGGSTALHGDTTQGCQATPRHRPTTTVHNRCNSTSRTTSTPIPRRLRPNRILSSRSTTCTSRKSRRIPSSDKATCNNMSQQTPAIHSRCGKPSRYHRCNSVRFSTPQSRKRLRS